MGPREISKELLTLGVKEIEKDEKRGICVAFEAKSDPDKQIPCGIILYDRETGECIGRYEFPSENVIGNVRYGFIEEVDLAGVSYLFFEGESVWTDIKAAAYVVEGRYGEKKAKDDYKALQVEHAYDWEGVSRPHLAYSESIVYCLHVRGFTKHESAGVIGNGTFQGIMEKLDYLKDLGITTLELQPCYEFDEAGLNYWGYKEACYYAPKKHYAFSEDPVKELKDLVKACHKNHMEVILQFYFPNTVPRTEIPEILRYWSYHYQIDGFHVKGDHLPLQELITDPYLAECKIMHHYFPDSPVKANGAVKKRLGIYDEKYMYGMRRFLKSDVGTIKDAMKLIRRCPSEAGVINFFSNYYGFTMMDMVSYNRKHNEANGENNRDGVDYNFTWNCGEEGPSKKRNVLKLRKQQLYNAFVMLMLSQGTPLLFMGDEFGNSQGGNNNPYGQDNETTWLNWEDKNAHEDLFDFVKSLIAFRRKNKVFHMDKQCTMTDYLSVGYPDLSYHNHAAWMPGIDEESRHIAFMLNGDYAEGCEGELWYVAMNMHWEPQEFALPKLPEGAVWEKCMTTESAEGILAYGAAGMRDRSVVVAPRSIAVYCGKK